LTCRRMTARSTTVRAGSWDTQLGHAWTHDVLARSALFAPLSAADRAAVAARMRRVFYEPGRVIFSRGDAGREIYLVLEGKVRLSVLTADGRELTFAHAGPGDIFGEIAALDGGERSAGATAITRVQGMLLAHTAFLNLVEENPQVATAAIAFLCARLRETDLRLEAIALHRIEVRLARLLLSVVRLEVPDGATSVADVELGLSQTEIALLIGASRPKTNIAMSMLEDVGAIKREGMMIACNIESLQRMAEAE
jgi:CRP/FNR family transcriptional regulator, cyclic AMP receptor protein